MAKITRRAKDACARAIAILGGRAEAARRLRRSYQAVDEWRQVPAGLAITIERLTGVPRSDLRPDLYPDEQKIRPPKRPVYLAGGADEIA